VSGSRVKRSFCSGVKKIGGLEKFLKWSQKTLRGGERGEGRRARWEGRDKRGRREEGVRRRRGGVKGKMEARGVEGEEAREEIIFI
jgi:hypothetical protein